MGKNEPSKRCTAIVQLSRVDLPSQISHAWGFFFLKLLLLLKLYLYFKFSSTDLATKAGQRKILCIVMRARKASPQMKTQPFNNPLPSSAGMTMRLQAVLSGALSVGIGHDNE